jgi:hypothetical protein
MKTINRKPGAWICTNDNDRQNRGRTKVYQPGSKIYLNDNEEFEIELFNPTTYNVKAEISIDGKKISSGGLVIKSGQRVYLECFPDSQRKFTFKTYEVENSNEAREAISNNGRVDIKFYREKIHYNYIPYYTNTYYGNTFGTCNTRGIGGSTLTSGDVFYSNSLQSNISSDSNMEFNTASLDSLSIETGQTEGGDKSNQEFESVYMDFESWVLSSYTFQLLPMSQKPIEPKRFKKKKSKSINKVEELTKLKDLLESEIIDQTEFEELKSEIMRK